MGNNDLARWAFGRMRAIVNYAPTVPDAYRNERRAYQEILHFKLSGSKP
jgi:hypothetical protein